MLSGRLIARVKVMLAKTMRAVVMLPVPGAIALGALMLTTPAIGLASGPEFQATYTCDLFGAVVPVDAAAARQVAQVPPSFHLTGEQTGKAALEFDAAVCDPVTVAGAAAPPMNYALVSVLTDSDPTAPNAGYDRWESTNNVSWSIHSNAIGKLSLLLNPLAINITRTGGIATAGDAQVNRADSPYRLTATLAGAPAPLPDFASEHWYQGPLGTVHKHDDNTAASAGAAQVTLTTPPGTVFYQLVGKESSTLPGLFLHFNAASSFTLGPPFPPQSLTTTPLTSAPAGLGGRPISDDHLPVTGTQPSTEAFALVATSAVVCWLLLQPIPSLIRALPRILLARP